MKNRPLFSICLVLLLGMILAVTAGGGRLIRELSPSPLEQTVSGNDRVLVLGEVYLTEQKAKVQAIYLKNNSIRCKDASFYENRILIYTDPEIQVQIGNIIQVSGEADFFDTARNPGNFDQKLYYQRMDIHGLIWADAVVVKDGRASVLLQALSDFRQEWKEMLVRYMGERDGQTLAAMMLGEKSGMDPEIKSMYQATGIGHILAISGLHLTFLGLGAYSIIRRMAGSYGAAGMAGILLMILYVVMIGFTVSVVRSLIMFLFRVGADMTGRHYDGLTSLTVSAVVILFWRPLYLYDGGFWLSFGAVAAMIWLLPEFRGLPMQGFWASLCVNIVILPILLYYFFEFPVYSVLLNLWVVPLSSALLALGMAGSLLAVWFPGAGVLILQLCGWILDLFEVSCRGMLELPGARQVTGRPLFWQIILYFGILILIFCIWKLSGRAQVLVLYVAAVLCLCLRLNGPGDISVTVLDVGQGDCIFIRGPEGGCYLVDGGSSDVGSPGQYRIEPFLKSQGVGRLDYVWVTHGDEDHVNGIEELLKRQKIGVSVGALILPPGEVWDERLGELGQMAKKAGVKVYSMKPETSIREKDMEITCLGPSGSVLPGNEASLILALNYQSFDMLLTGDVEGEGEKALTDRIRKEPEKTWEVLKASHHGSKNSTGGEFLEAANPEYTIISAGRDNRYGHPHAETLERLAACGSCVLSTQEYGAIQIMAEADGKLTIDNPR